MYKMSNIAIIYSFCLADSIGRRNRKKLPQFNLLIMEKILLKTLKIIIKKCLKLLQLLGFYDKIRGIKEVKKWIKNQVQF
jgi:hypothetical protein